MFLQACNREHARPRCLTQNTLTTWRVRWDSIGRPETASLSQSLAGIGLVDGSGGVVGGGGGFHSSDGRSEDFEVAQWL